MPEVPSFQAICCLLFVVLFAVSYYLNCVSKKLWIDFYHAFVFLRIIFPFFFISLFAYEFKNWGWVGDNVNGIRDAMPEAFGITCLGSLIVLLVSSRWLDKVLPRTGGLSKLHMDWMRGLLSRKSTVEILGCIAIAGVLGVELYLAVTSGAGALGFREHSLIDGRLRPFFNFFVIAFSPIVLFALLTSWMDTKSRSPLILACILGFLVALSGSRTSVLSPILYLVLLGAQRTKRKRIKFITVAATTLLIGAALLGMGKIRSGADESTSQLDEVLYGDNFSDVRDFAWVLSRWDREELHGKSYIAGALGFIPREFIAYREEFSIATYVNRFLGFEKDTHGGLRPGMYGEAYLNFGIPGVVIQAFMLGIILGDVRARLDQLHRSGVDRMAVLGSVIGPLYLFDAIVITSAFWWYYVFLVSVGISKVIWELAPKKPDLHKRVSFVNRQGYRAA
jgi:oligosaccharide repeat unit polymerase